jgi:subtilisin-like proprotein convertase family protein
MRHFYNIRRMSRCFCATFTLGLILLFAGSSAALAGGVVWQDWAFDHEVSGDSDGLSLLNVRFHGRTLIKKMSVPVMRVFYTNNTCGPYADRLGGTLYPISWANDADLAQREFTGADGRLWYEIGIRDKIGSYDIYQVYYLSSDGIIDAHIYSKGLQCIQNHIHYPNWRIDFDIDGTALDQIQRNTGAGFTTLTSEFDLNAASSPTHAWRVRDAASGLYVDVLPGFPDFNIPDGSTTVPVTAFDQNTVFGRLFHDAEDSGWIYGPNTQVRNNNGESIDGADVILWYEGYLPHNASEGSELWHSTGLRLVTNLGANPPTPTPTPTPPPVSHTQSFTGAAVSIPDGGAGSPYPSTINVSGVNGTIRKLKIVLSSLSHAYPDDLDIVLVGPDGRAVKLISDVGGSGNLNAVTLTIDPSATATLPNSSQIVSGVFKPTNYGSSDPFPPPVPNSTGTDLNVFNRLSPNGLWKLYIVDDARGDSGNLAGGWKLTMTVI